MNCASLSCVPCHDRPAADPATRWCRLVLLSLAFIAFCSPSPARAGYVITGGSAAWTLDEGKAAAIDTFNAYFNELATRTQCLNDPAPGNAPWTDSGSTVTLTDDIRAYGVTPVPFPGTPGVTRSPQKTTLEIEDTSNVLGSWTTSNNAIAFVGNSTLSEQIAFTNMQRWTGPFQGVLIYGDFGLRYTGSKLVLTSNIDFLNAAFADIGTPNISVIGNTLTISGDLLIGGGLAILDPNAVPGTKFGTISIRANLAPVPEPASVVLMASGIFGIAVVLLRRRQKSDA